jgi:DNA-binding HxlR family transcriptional regulator
VDGSSVAELLKLTGAGATGQILFALDPRALRTKKLTERIPAFAPRTIYRHARRLTELELIDREEIPGVPSTVIHSLSDPTGKDLVRLIAAYAKVTLPPHADPRTDPSLWGSLGLIGEMWGYDWIEVLSYGGQSVTDMTELTDGMTFHQVTRRLHQLVSWGLVYESTARGQRKRYQLSDRTRKAMAMIVGLGRWRQQHVLDGCEGGLNVSEMTTVLRTSLPLLELPDHRETSIQLGIVGTTGTNGDRGSETLMARVSPGGGVRCIKGKPSSDAWVLGAVDTWFAALLDGDRKRLRVGGDLDFVDHCLKQLHETLWAPAPVEAVAAR